MSVSDFSYALRCRVYATPHKRQDIIPKWTTSGQNSEVVHLTLGSPLCVAGRYAVTVSSPDLIIVHKG